MSDIILNTAVDGEHSIGANLKQAHERFINNLNNEHVIGANANKLLALAEEKTNVKRQNYAYGAGGIAALVLVFAPIAELLCNGSGVIVPFMSTWATAAKPNDPREATRWLTYWTAFGAWSVADFWRCVV